MSLQYCVRYHTSFFIEPKEIEKDSYQETEPPLRPLPKALVREMDFNDRRELAMEKLRNYPA